MTSTFVNDLRLNEMGTGDQSGTWGNVTNTNLELIAEALGFGTEAITTNADTHTTTIADGATDPGRAIYIKYTGTLDSACTITIGPNTISRLHIIENATSGSQNIIISQGSGSSVTIGNGAVKAVYLDGAGSGAAVNDALVDLDLTGTTTVAALTSSGVITGTTLEATGDTSAGDNAAIGFTSTEGLILTGQGSTNDVTIKNDADADVISIPTGTTGVTFAGAITANAGVVVDNITIDGNEIDLSSGDLTLDSAGDIILDVGGADVAFRAAGTGYLQVSSVSSDAKLLSLQTDKDIIFSGIDSGSEIEAMRIDMSEGGKVGIGTSSPATALDVDGGANSDQATFSGTASRGLKISTFSVGAADEGVDFDAQASGSTQALTFSTGGTERVRVDGSGLLRIGNTSGTVFDSSSATGIIAGTSLQVSNSAGTVGFFNRLSSDGTILGLYKDGSSVGSVGTGSSRICIGNGDTFLTMAGDLDAVYPASSSSTTPRDNAVDLGTSGTRFNNIYLSGGVFVGGTGGGNKLEDYEEGTFTASFNGSTSNPTISYSAQVGTYVKVGKLVQITVSVIASGTPSGGGGNLRISGLPFTSKSGVQQAGTVAFTNTLSATSGTTQMSCNIEESDSVIHINEHEYSGTSSMNRMQVSALHNSSPRIVCSICYEVA